jgi:hypothetical protein
METGSSENLALLAMEAFGRVGVFRTDATMWSYGFVSIVWGRVGKRAYLKGLDCAEKPPVCGHFNGGDDADVGLKIGV